VHRFCIICFNRPEIHRSWGSLFKFIGSHNRDREKLYPAVAYVYLDVLCGFKSLKVSGPAIQSVSSSPVQLAWATVFMESPSAAVPPPFSETRVDSDTSEKNPLYSKIDEESTTGTDTTGVLQNERDIVTHVISVEDDPSLNPWTFRSFFIGIGLSAFGGVLGEHPSLRWRVAVAHQVCL
jgi:hypothetical protein